LQNTNPAKMTGQIRTKSVNDPIGAEDGARILVTRYHPRIKGFVKGVGKGYVEWYRNLAPSKELLAKFKNGIVTEQQFGQLYLEELKKLPKESLHGINGQQFPLEIKEILDHIANSGNVTLLCFEQEGEFCHRNLLKSYIEQMAANLNTTAK
jgi:uncharacterized protein YeaO (DUF488 family)